MAARATKVVELRGGDFPSGYPPLRATNAAGQGCWRRRGLWRVRKAKGSSTSACRFFRGSSRRPSRSRVGSGKSLDEAYSQTIPDGARLRQSEPGRTELGRWRQARATGLGVSRPDAVLLDWCPLRSAPKVEPIPHIAFAVGIRMYSARLKTCSTPCRLGYSKDGVHGYFAC
jgi:hypothetical protein